MILLTALAIIGCISCRDIPTDVLANELPTHRAKLLGEIQCLATPQSGTLECSHPPADESAASQALYGLNQVTLESSNVVYDTTTLIFAFDVTVQNLLAHPMGTPDGVTVTGLKVFYDSGPTVTSFVAPHDTGTVWVANADGTENFTSENQPFHFYDQILSPLEVTPAKRWQLRIPRSVNTFSFRMRIFTRIPSEPTVPPTEAPNGFFISADSLASLYSPERAVLSHSRLSGPYPQSIVLVRFRDSASADERQSAINLVNGEVIGGYGYTYYAVLIPPDSSGNTLWSAVSQLENLPGVVDAGPDLLYLAEPYHIKPTDGPGWSGGDWNLDPSLAAGDNWASEAIGAPFAWGCATGDNALKIAVVDMASANPHHPEWVSSVIRATANDGVGMTGLVWSGQFAVTGGTSGDIAGDLYNAIVSGNRVINLSWGAGYRDTIRNSSGVFPRRRPDHTAKDDSISMEFARRVRGIIMQAEARSNNQPLYIVAAGNYGRDAWTAGLPRLMTDSIIGSRVLVVAGSDSTHAVGSTSDRLLLALPMDPIETGSNYGSLVEIVAPGGWVRVESSAGPATLAGTSFAAPHVTGIAGLVLAFDPRISSDSLKQILIRGAVASGQTSGGYPFANAYESLRIASRAVGAPLCGNRIWTSGTAVYAERASGPELLFDAATGIIAEVNALHGGRQVLFTDESTWDLRRFVYQQGGWAEDPSPGALWDSVGPSLNSLRARSHDGDQRADAYQTDTHLVVTHDDSIGSRILAQIPLTRRTETANSECMVIHHSVGGPSTCQQTLAPNESVWQVSDIAYGPLGNQVLVAVRRQDTNYSGTGEWHSCEGKENDADNVWQCRNFAITETIAVGRTIAVSIANGAYENVGDSAPVSWLAMADGTKEYATGVLSSTQSDEGAYYYNVFSWHTKDVGTAGSLTESCHSEYRSFPAGMLLQTFGNCRFGGVSFSPYLGASPSGPKR